MLILTYLIHDFYITGMSPEAIMDRHKIDPFSKKKQKLKMVRNDDMNSLKTKSATILLIFYLTTFSPFLNMFF